MFSMLEDEMKVRMAEYDETARKLQLQMRATETGRDGGRAPWTGWDTSLAPTARFPTAQRGMSIGSDTPGHTPIPGNVIRITNRV